MSATTLIRFTQPYAGWTQGAEHTVRLDVAMSLDRIGVAEILDSPAPTPATVTPDPADISAEIPAGLEAIRGIGPAKLRALAEAGVRTLADLINADRTRLDANLDGTSSAQIDKWIGEAYRLDQANMGEGKK